MNNLTAKRVIKRQYNTIIDEDAKISRVLNEIEIIIETN